MCGAHFRFYIPNARKQLDSYCSQAGGTFTDPDVLAVVTCFSSAPGYFTECVVYTVCVQAFMGHFHKSTQNATT